MPTLPNLNKTIAKQPNKSVQSVKSIKAAKVLKLKMVKAVKASRATRSTNKPKNVQLKEVEVIPDAKIAELIEKDPIQDQEIEDVEDEGEEITKKPNR